MGTQPCNKAEDQEDKGEGGAHCMETVMVMGVSAVMTVE